MCLADKTMLNSFVVSPRSPEPQTEHVKAQLRNLFTLK